MLLLLLIIYWITAACLIPVIVGIGIGSKKIDNDNPIEIILKMLVVMIIAPLILPFGILYLIGFLPAESRRKDKQHRQDSLDDLKR